MQLSPVDHPLVPQDFHLKLRQRFIETFLKQSKNQIKNGLCLFKGIQTLHKNYDDIDHYVQQQSTFWYFFGVKQPDCHAAIHIPSGKSILFVPQLDENYKLWMTVLSKQQFKKIYKVDEVYFNQQIPSYLKQTSPQTIYLFSGIDSDSGLHVDQPSQKLLEGYTVNKQLLWPLISNLRAIKTEDQINILRYVCKVTSQAEKIAAKSAKVGLTQVQLHSVFHFQHSIKSGSIQLGFASICSSGRDCATLHYIDNDKIIEQDQMVLLDLGGKWYGYVADQAMTFPVSGKFTQKQAEIYTAVLQAQKQVKKNVKAGIKWDQMHLLAQRVILNHLIKIGIVNDYPIQQLVQKRVGALFFPHGLGHLFGLKVHDLGGYTHGPARSEAKGLCKLRTRRVLQAGMCITVQPGLYFIDFMLEKAYVDQNLSKYLNKEIIDSYKHVGGVRLQDDILVTENGYELLSNLPRQIEDVQNLLKK